jgi:predicted anti-sigma-YlaC factor YlaD
MRNEETASTQHVGALISGYLDGELTQQERQRVDVHLGDCVDCSGQMAELADLRKRLSGARLSLVGEDIWREKMDDMTVKVSRGIGWLLFLGGLLLVAGFGIWEFVIDTSMGLVTKLVVSAVYVGLGALFLSVLRQRLIERKTDKYKDVEI